MKRPSKYGAVRTEVDGIKFASKKEARRYSELKLLERVHKINRLRLQPRYPLVVNNLPICTYVADFEYHTWDGVRVVEDAKGVRTPIYKLKRALMYAIHDISVAEV